MNYADQQQHRSRIAREMNITDRSLTEDDLGRYCTAHPTDAYCVAHAQQRAAIHTQRDWIAYQIGTSPEELTDREVFAYCDANRSPFSPVADYCNYMLHRDSYDRAAIAREVGATELSITDTQLRTYCAAHPQNEYCVRNNLVPEPAPTPLPETTLGLTRGSTSGSFVETLVANRGYLALAAVAVLALGGVTWLATRPPKSGVRRKKK